MKLLTKYPIVAGGLILAGLAASTLQAHAQGGVPLWTNRYHGPSNGEANAVTVAVDNSGNAFVTGYSPGTNGSSTYATVAYSGAGVPLWTNRYGADAGPDVGLAVAVDSGGNVIVTGKSYGGASGEDYATMAYSNAGVPLWTNRYNGPGNGQDVAAGVAVDNNGNVFVTGSSAGSGNWPACLDYATVAYSAAGVPLWTNGYNGPGNGLDAASAIAVDSAGSVFVAGSATAPGGNLDYQTVAYSGAGVPLWTNRYRGPGNGGDSAVALAVDQGNVFVTGGSPGTNGYYAYATVAYSSTGVALWTNRYEGAGQQGDVAHALAVDRSGNVFVTGDSAGTNGFVYATVAYSGAGLSLWTNRYHGPGNGHDHARAVAVDSGGNVFVTGESLGSGSSYDYATVAYSSAGVPLWTNRYHGPGSGEDRAISIAVDRAGNVFVTGSSAATNGFHDFATIKYSSSLLPVHLTITSDGSGGYFIRFNGIPGRTYRLQRATNLPGPWTSSAPQSAPASGLVEFWDLFPPPGQAFYRTVQP